MALKQNWSRGLIIQALALMLLAAQGFSGQTAGPAKIRIITPMWEGQTNADGTGLFFDIVRAVYEPAGIALEVSFAPWKRCQALVAAKRRDAMLCVWQTHARNQGQITPELPLYIERTAAVVKKASGIAWKGLHSLDCRRAVWLRGYNYQTAPRMRGIQLSDWHEVDSHEEAWLQLNLDRFDAYIDALIDIDHYVKSERVDPGLYQIHLLWKQKAYAAFADTRRSRELIRIYDARAPDLLASGRLARIHGKWGVRFDPADWSP